MSIEFDECDIWNKAFYEYHFWYLIDDNVLFAE